MLFCRRGFRGNALASCTRGECLHDTECPQHLACFDYRCQDPCNGACGTNSECQVILFTENFQRFSY